jgi:hypothetical protein
MSSSRLGTYLGIVEAAYHNSYIRHCHEAARDCIIGAMIESNAVSGAVLSPTVKMALGGGKLRHESLISFDDQEAPCTPQSSVLSEKRSSKRTERENTRKTKVKHRVDHLRTYHHFVILAFFCLLRLASGDLIMRPVSMGDDTQIELSVAPVDAWGTSSMGGSLVVDFPVQDFPTCTDCDMEKERLTWIPGGAEIKSDPTLIQFYVPKFAAEEPVEVKVPAWFKVLGLLPMILIILWRIIISWDKYLFGVTERECVICRDSCYQFRYGDRNARFAYLSECGNDHYQCIGCVSTWYHHQRSGSGDIRNFRFRCVECQTPVPIDVGKLHPSYVPFQVLYDACFTMYYQQVLCRIFPVLNPPRMVMQRVNQFPYRAADHLPPEPLTKSEKIQIISRLIRRRLRGYYYSRFMIRARNIFFRICGAIRNGINTSIVISRTVVGAVKSGYQYLVACLRRHPEVVEDIVPNVEKVWILVHEPERSFSMTLFVFYTQIICEMYVIARSTFCKSLIEITGLPSFVLNGFTWQTLAARLVVVAFSLLVKKLAKVFFNNLKNIILSRIGWSARLLCDESKFNFNGIKPLDPIYGAEVLSKSIFWFGNEFYSKRKCVKIHTGYATELRKLKTGNALTKDTLRQMTGHLAYLHPESDSLLRLHTCVYVYQELELTRRLENAYNVSELSGVPSMHF